MLALYLFEYITRLMQALITIVGCHIAPLMQNWIFAIKQNKVTIYTWLEQLKMH